MSVVKSQREETKLTVITKANELTAYTIKICSNEKNFPKRYRWCITSKIVESAISISNDLIRANSIYIQSVDDRTLRSKYQKEALTETYALLNMINIAYQTFGIDANRIKHWTQLVNEVQSLIRSWRKSDANRKIN
ncbi:MAG: four helix bundle protein [Clostridia bacterium]|nr:four helix bundle protein [Clostridia bacterium]